VAAFERPTKEQLGPLLPTLNGRLRREPVFEENELAAGLEDPSDASNSLHYAGNCAQAKGAHDLECIGRLG
jgi:hypothetical protein